MVAFAGAEAAEQTEICGDVDGSGTVAASDALLLLKRAVGQQVTILCPGCVALTSRAAAAPFGASAEQPQICGDLDGSGSAAASDALLLLKRVVGQNVSIACPTCSTTTTSTAPTTTVPGATTTTLLKPESCGNGVVDGTEQCEKGVDCADGERCTALCTCETIPADPPTSQELIAQALARGEIDYPTSILYRVWALFLAPELPEQFDGAGSAGEDTDLVIELSHERGNLPAEIESAIAPYLVRPTDPTSIYSKEPPPVFTARAADCLDGAETVNCPVVNGRPDWGYFETEHFVVWSCDTGRCLAGKPRTTACKQHEDCDTAPSALDGVCTAAADGSRRPVAATLAEEAYAKITPKLGPPRADDFADGPEPRGRIDIYLLRPNETRCRAGKRVAIGDALAAAFADTPCDRTGGGPLRSSGYAMLRANAVPRSAPGSDEPSELRGSLVHELFHVYEYGLNVEVMGKTCAPSPVQSRGRTWLTEASAEWAGTFGFYGGIDKRERRANFFQDFQTTRRPETEGLQSTDDLLPYQSALYLKFLQQEAGGIQPIVDLWKTSQAARTREDFDAHLDSIAPFKEHFRDFAVRDLNKPLAGSPIDPLFFDLDDAVLPGVLPQFLEPTVTLKASLDHLDIPVAVAPLFAQFELYKVDDSARYVKVNVSDAPNAAHLQIDAIVKVGATWSRRKVNGPVFQFCREDEGDDISEFYLVLSNHDRNREGKIDGLYQIETKPYCPGGWSGDIRVEQTLQELSEETIGDASTTITRDERELHRWTVGGTSYVTPDGYPFEVEQLDTTWHGTRTVWNVTEWSSASCSKSVSTESGDGSGSASTPFQAFPTYPGAYSLTVADPGHEFEFTRKFMTSDCNGTSTSQGTEMKGELLAYLGMVAELSMLTPAPNDPGHFAGRVTLIHDEQPRPGGGSEIQDVTVTWDLRRTEQR